MLQGINIGRISQILFLFASLLAQITYAVPLNSNASSLNYLATFSPDHAHIFLQLGGFNASQGKTQNIGIEGLVGDHFTVSQHEDHNVLLGIGYFIDGFDTKKFNLMYGVNTFYLAQTIVRGNIIQEQLFNNLSYQYSITNYPVCVAGKALINTHSNKYNITLDLGIGPNIMYIHKFHEHPINPTALPDQIFSGNTSVAFSTTAGFGVKLNNVFKYIPLEIGYRFFYLGQGQLNKNNNQLKNTLKTGNSYANALIISTST